MAKELGDKFWEIIYNRPLDFTPLVELSIDLWLDDIFPHIEIPKQNSIVVRNTDG